MTPGSPIAESTLNPERQKRRRNMVPAWAATGAAFAQRDAARVRGRGSGERIAFWCVDIDGSSIAILQRIIGEFAVKIGARTRGSTAIPRRRRRMASALIGCNRSPL